MMMLKVQLLLCLNILSLLQFKEVQSDCVVKYPADVEISPIYRKIFGKYSVELPYNGKDIQLNEGEIIEGICRTNFSSISYTRTSISYEYEWDSYGNRRRLDNVEVLKNQTTITLQCLSNQLKFDGFVLNENILECTKLQWSIYDVNEKYEWCEKNLNAKSFLLAVKSNQDHHILAGICYNLNKWSLLTITYNVTNFGQKYNVEMLRDITKTDLKSYQSLGDDLLNFKTTKSFDLTELELQYKLTEMSEKNPWLYLATYEISPIVQGDSYEKYFGEYVNILNTLWWRSLRLGNWKLFMNTLENYAYNNSFQLYTGTSGVVKFPTRNNGDFKILEVQNGHLNKTLPAYIWAYLTSTDRLNEDFIIVGYNSPYAEFFNINNVVFCPNICSEIPWLKEISSSFHFATAGIMFCCSPEFIRQSNYLHGFPIDVLISRANILQQNKSTEIENSTATLLNDEYTQATNEPSLSFDVNSEQITESLFETNVTEENLDLITKEPN